MRRFVERLFGGASSPAPTPRANQALWSIGVFAGRSPLALGPDPSIPNPAITRDDVIDVPASFVADPFLHRAGDTWHLLFEVLNRRSGLGEIAHATSPDLATWTYDRVVLAEPFHLSYPHLLEWEGALYMVPETHQSRSIRLYRGDSLPGRWTHVHTLLSGGVFSDSTLFRHDDRWWMFTETSEPRRHDTLRLFHADDLFGAWTEHPASPIVTGDRTTARPAGSIVRTERGLVRFAQVCTPRYGMSVRAFLISKLTPTAYGEQAASAEPVLAGSGVVGEWNATRMHHVDAHEIAPGRWIAAVDGARDVTKAEVDGDA
jgi:hypothetical protein